MVRSEGPCARLHLDGPAHVHEAHRSVASRGRMRCGSERRRAATPTAKSPTTVPGVAVCEPAVGCRGHRAGARVVRRLLRLRRRCESPLTAHAAQLAASSLNLAVRRTCRRVLHTRAQVPALGMCSAAAAVGSVVEVAHRRGGHSAAALRLRQWLRTGPGACRCHRLRRAGARRVKDLSQRALHFTLRRGLMPLRVVRLQARPHCAGSLRFRSRCQSTCSGRPPDAERERQRRHEGAAHDPCSPVAHAGVLHEGRF